MRPVNLPQVVLDKSDAWIKAGIREVNLKCLPRAPPINEEQAMWKRIYIFTINRNVLWIRFLMMEGDLTNRYGDIP
jgi:hypothetical protein